MQKQHSLLPLLLCLISFMFTISAMQSDTISKKEPCTSLATPNTPQATITDLPHELLLHIASHFDDLTQVFLFGQSNKQINNALKKYHNNPKIILNLVGPVLNRKISCFIADTPSPELLPDNLAALSEKYCIAALQEYTARKTLEKQAAITFGALYGKHPHISSILNTLCSKNETYKQSWTHLTMSKQASNTLPPETQAPADNSTLTKTAHKNLLTVQTYIAQGIVRQYININFDNLYFIAPAFRQRINSLQASYEKLNNLTSNDFLQELRNEVENNCYDVDFYPAKNRLNLLHSATYQNNLNKTKDLIAFGADIACLDRLGHTPLHAAVLYNHSQIAHLLISLYTQEQCAILNHKGTTSLHEAIISNRTVTQALIEKSSPTLCNIQNKEGNTPLHIAARTGSTHSVNLLINKLDQKQCGMLNKQNCSALDFALARDHSEIVDMLRQKTLPRYKRAWIKHRYHLFCFAMGFLTAHCFLR